VRTAKPFISDDVTIQFRIIFLLVRVGMVRLVVVQIGVWEKWLCKGKVSRNSRKLRTVELRGLGSLSSVIRTVKLNRRRMKHVARIGERVNLRERDHLGDPGVDGRIILRWILRKWDVGVWTGSSWLRIRTGGGLL
jgi:hypothetical protein